MFSPFSTNLYTTTTTTARSDDVITAAGVTGRTQLHLEGPAFHHRTLGRVRKMDGSFYLLYYQRLP